MALEKQVKPPTIGVVEIGIDCRDPASLAPFWIAATGYEIGDFDPAEVYLDLRPPSKELPVIYFQRVPEEKIVKNRLHLDLYVEDVDSTADFLVTHGGRRLGDLQTGSAGGKWQVMVDPEGNEFCLCLLSKASETSSGQS